MEPNRRPEPGRHLELILETQPLADDHTDATIAAAALVLDKRLSQIDATLGELATEISSISARMPA